MWAFARRFLRVFAVTLISTVLVPVVVVATIVGSLIFLPLPAALPTPKLILTSQPSVVYDANGNQIATFSQFEQNLPVQQSDIPLVLKQAVISSEDKNFYHHGGVDPRGSLRALVRDLQGKNLQGGSTIAQQYVKNAYTGGKRTLTRKLREAILASQLARQLPKDEILYKYLQTIYFGDGAYGVGAAAETYFHKRVNDLTIGEAALLAGLIPAPSVFEPRGNPTLAEERRELVLRKMLDQGYINSAQYAYWRVAQVFPADKIGLLPPGSPATLVYPPVQQPVVYPYFVDYVKRWLELDPRVGPSRLYRAGLRIQTTIDPTLQAKAQAAINDTLSGTREPLEMSLVSVDPQNGFVKALIGGRDFNADQTNLALGGCEPVSASIPIVVQATCRETSVPEGGGQGRQAGSSFKPFTLATAFANGVQPSEVFSAPTCYTPRGAVGSGNTICNAESAPFGSLNLRQATWYSVNTVYAQLILDRRVGVQKVAETAKSMGITSAWYSPRVHGASYTLGVVGVSPLDMASAYGVLANHGSRVPATPVALVEDPANHVVIDNRTPTGTQVLSAAIADNVTDILRGVITQPGATGTAANINRPAAGKTGTASTHNSYSDAWFVGYVPTLSTSVWMGNKDSENHSLRGTKGVYEVFGGTFPARTWAAYMSQALQGVPPTDFSQPPPLEVVANQIERQARHGIDPGSPRYPTGVGTGGPYQYSPGPPRAIAPPPPTVVTEPPRTTTTVAGGGGGGGGSPGTLFPP